MTGKNIGEILDKKLKKLTIKDTLENESDINTKH